MVTLTLADQEIGGGILFQILPLLQIFLKTFNAYLRAISNYNLSI